MQFEALDRDASSVLYSVEEDCLSVHHAFFFLLPALLVLPVRSSLFRLLGKSGF